jgi:hypothetical protein
MVFPQAFIPFRFVDIIVITVHGMIWLHDRADVTTRYIRKNIYVWKLNQRVPELYFWAQLVERTKFDIYAFIYVLRFTLQDKVTLRLLNLDCLHNRYSRMVYDVGGHKATRVVLQCINGVSLNSIYRVVTSARSCNQIILYIYNVYIRRSGFLKLEDYKMRSKQFRLNWTNSFAWPTFQKRPWTVMTIMSTNRKGINAWGNTIA